jgi:ligand-binding sensor domain-containing protein/signal transduction histidine kinase
LFLGLLLTLALATHATHARDFAWAQPYFETVGDSESIPYGVVSVMMQDRRGFLWIGTQAGLIRYDGYRFRKFIHNAQDPGSIAGDYIQAITLAADGRIWVTTASDGISIFDPASERFEHIRNDPKRPDSLNDGRLSSLLIDGGGNLWVGSDQGLDYRAANSPSFIHLRHDANDDHSLADNRVMSLMQDPEQQVWVGSASGLQRIMPSDGKIGGKAGTQPPAKRFDNIAALKDKEIISLMRAQDGKLWFGTRKHGAGWLAPGSTQALWLPLDPKRADALNHGRVMAIRQIDKEQIWLGTYGGGINVVAARDGKVLTHMRQDASLATSLATDSIGSLLLDRSGLMWVGTWGSGLQRHNARNSAFRILRHSPTIEHSLSQADVASMLELANGQLLVGTRGNGIDIFDRKLGLVGGWRAQPGQSGMLPDSSVSAMAQTPDGTIWAGTHQAGIVRMRPGSKTWQATKGLPDGQIRRLYVDNKGTLWAGSNAGLARWNRARDQFETLSNEDGSPMFSSIYTLTGDKEDRIWAGSHTGLWVVEPDTLVMRGIHPDPKRADSLASNEVRGLLVDHEGQLWVDTQHGLDLMRHWDGKQAHFEHVSTQLGRPGMYFGSNLLEDKLGRIWTQWFVLDPKTMHLTTLSKADGLDIGTAWIGSYGRTRDGMLMYGGTQGLALIEAERFAPWDYAPQLAVTDLQINGHAQALGTLSSMGELPAFAPAFASASGQAGPRQAGQQTVPPAGQQIKGLVLEPEQSNFTIEFAALDLSAPQKNRYRYRLPGYDKDWNDVDFDHRSASYGNLWPGTYTLQIRARNRSGTAGANELSIPIQVLPAFWQTGWFSALMLLLLAGTVFGGYRWRLARLQAEALVLQNLIAARTADILKLGKIGQELTATLDTEQAFERIYKHIRARLDAFVFMIGIYDEEGERIVHVYEIENARRQPVSTTSMQDLNRPSVWCVRERREMITANRAEFLNYVNTILPPSCGEPMETVVYLPLMLEQQVIGCLSVQSPRQNAYSRDQLEFLRILASYTAIAVANASAHGKLSAAHQNLQQAQARLVESEKLASLGGLVAGIAHEINTPLGTSLVAISGAFDAWNNLRGMVATGRISRSALQECTDEGLAYSSLALRTATRAAELVTVFRSVGVKPVSDHVVKLELGSWLQEAAIVVKDRLAQISSQVEIDVGAGLYASVVPEALFETLNCVFANVMDHAFDAARCGTLRIAAWQALENDLVIEISDNGYGIAASDLPKVFDPFFSTKGGNLNHIGLGLYVAYNHVTQRLNGRIGIASIQDAGTTVRIDLPGAASIGP